MMTQALQCFQSGNHDEAEIILFKVLGTEPKNFDALHIYGVLKGIKNQHHEALGFFRKALKINPNHSFLNFNIAKAFSEIGEDEKALKFHSSATKLNPNYPEGWLNYGKSLLNLYKFDQSLNLFSRAVALNPDYAEAWTNLGSALKELGRFQEALDSFDKSLKINPHIAETWSNRGIALLKLKRVEEAVANFDNAIAINPDYADAYSNRGIALLELKRVEEAVANFDNAIAINPDYADAYSNRGIALLELKRLEEAVASYDKAIAIKPDHAKAHCNKSLAFLLAGKFAQGWGLYEWRWKKEDTVKNKRNFPQPLWLGLEDIANKTILLHAEQGLGDTIQFCRYVKLVKERGARVVLEVPEALLRLMDGLEGIDDLVEKGKVMPSFDFHCPLMSLPLAFKTTVESIPHLVPYIHLNKEKENKWRMHIGNSGFKIAICWQGSTKSQVDIGRSFPVNLFEGLAKINDVRLISLQKNEGVEQLKNLPAGMRIETLPDNFDNGDSAFIDSACVMKCADLVITSDTALTHLAGALGVKTWLPLRFVPDWRWMLDINDSPWYPNHRLFRQAIRDEWGSVFEAMELELRTIVLSK